MTDKIYIVSDRILVFNFFIDILLRNKIIKDPLREVKRIREPNDLRGRLKADSKIIFLEDSISLRFLSEIERCIFIRKIKTFEFNTRNTADVSRLKEYLK